MDMSILLADAANPYLHTNKHFTGVQSADTCMLQAMTTGNLDQAPPELRDVLVPLHVRVSQL